MSEIAAPRSRRSWSAVPALALIAAGLLSASPAPAAVDTYNIDVEHTAVTFSVRHFFSKVPGRFTRFEGVILLDETDLANSSVSFEIDADSIDTNEAKRDRHLRSDAFFDVENHPKITFVSDKVTPRDDGKLDVHGKLTIRGKTLPVVLDAEALGFGEVYSVRRAAFEIRIVINRYDYGVSWNDLVEGGGFILGEEVEILINLEAKKAKSPDVAAK